MRYVDICPFPFFRYIEYPSFCAVGYDKEVAICILTQEPMLLNKIVSITVCYCSIF